MLARCHQLQSIFRLLKPFLHVQIWCQSVAFFQNQGVEYSDSILDVAVLPLIFFLETPILVKK